MRIGVLALQGDVAEHTAALTDLGVEPAPVRRPDDLAGLDGIVLPGGESTTMSMLLESSGLDEPLGKELAAGLPAFGTCAGLILLATTVTDGRPDQHSYGVIDLTARRNGFGRQLDSFECDLAVRGMDDSPLHAVFIRAPMVEAAGAGVEVLAEIPRPARPVAGAALAAGAAGAAGAGERGPVPVLCRQGQVLVAAFHPELTEDRRVHELFLSMVDDKGR
ncbi:MAG: pyridoxal 5'-phosphate synthase glutaminase subunit PdxT [Gemmatimonadales bacterium]